MSLGAGAYQVGEAGQCSREQPPPGTVKYLRKYQYLPCPELKRKGGLGKNAEQKCQASNKAVAKTFAKNCKQATVYSSITRCSR